MPVLAAAGGELTLQAGQVVADHRLVCMIYMYTPSEAQAQRASELFPQSWTESSIFLCVCCLRRGSFISANPLYPFASYENTPPNCWYNLCYKWMGSRGFVWMMGVCCRLEATGMKWARWGNEHSTGAGTAKVGKEITEEKKLNSEGNMESMTRLIGRVLVVDWLGVYWIDGRRAIWVWIILARITVWDFVTLFLFLWYGRS